MAGGGMEYPMIAMENRSADVYDLFNVVTHEIGFAREVAEIEAWLAGQTA